MKIKFSCWVLIIGYLFDFLGLWMKTLHQAGSDLVITAALLLKIIGLTMLVIFLFKHPAVKAFLRAGEFDDSFK